MAGPVILISMYSIACGDNVGDNLFKGCEMYL